jgi:PAS domain S-box-containing protein
MAAIADVSDRKRAEERLRESEERYRDLFELAPYAYVSLRTDGRIRTANERAAEVLGYPREELAGKPVLDLYADTPAGRDKALRLLERFRAGQAFRDEELQIRRPDGSVRWISLSVGLIRDAIGELAGSRSVHVDITARKEAEAATEAAGAELERVNAELADMAYGVGHDLAEPVRAVTMHLRMLNRRYRERLDDEAGELIDGALEGASHMRALLASLRLYIKAGLTERVEAVDCGDLMAEVLHGLRSAIEEAGATVTVDPLPTVHGDATQLWQVFQNLISNAIKFATRDVPPRVRVWAQRDDGGWRFSVQDEGIGIAPERQDEVFGMFRRAHGGYGGTGIGLAVCRRIVEAHGGRIWLESAPGEGSTFSFTVPDA